MSKISDKSLSRDQLTRARRLVRDARLQAPAGATDANGASDGGAKLDRYGAALPASVDPNALARLSKLIRVNRGTVTEAEIKAEVNGLSADAAKSFEELYHALLALKDQGRLEPSRSAELLTPGLVTRIANGNLLPRDERQLHQRALTDLYRLFNRPGTDDGLHEQLGAELTRVHQLTPEALLEAEARPSLTALAEDRRRAYALQAVLHSSQGKLPELKISDELKAQYVARLGECADATALPLLRDLEQTGAPAVAAAAKRSAVQITRASEMTVVSVTMESPFSPVGGLSNVMGSEPQALARQGHRSVVITARHGNIDPVEHKLVDSGLGPFTLDTADGPRSFKLLQAELDGTAYYFIDDSVDPPRHPLFSNRTGVYNDAAGEFGDNPQRYDFFARAAVVAQQAILKGEEPDIIQANDAHAGLVPLYVKEAGLQRTATAMVIHNLAFQNTFDMAARDQLSFGRDESKNHLFGAMGNLEFYGQVNLMKAGLTEADGAITVSSTYRDETLKLEDKGAGLGGVLAVKAAYERYFGRMNGVDLAQWDPRTDPALPAHFDVRDLSGKALNKKALLDTYALKDASLPLLGSVGRVDAYQKGYDDLIVLIKRAMTEGPKSNFIVLGKGDPAVMAELEALAAQYPDHVAFDPKFEGKKEHQLIAGSDFLVMLSRFEPGGQPDIYALAQGTVPLVRATGGLDEAIEQYQPGAKSGNGFKFTGADPMPMYSDAVALYHQGPAAMRPLIENAFASAKTFSWDNSAEQTAAIFRRLLKE
jgi:starch synthase